MKRLKHNIVQIILSFINPLTHKHDNPPMNNNLDRKS